MKKKLVIGFAPLLAIVVFSVMPVAAQATTPHWTVNGVYETGVQTPANMWGEISVIGAKGGNPGLSITCDTGGIVTIENPLSGTAGIGETEVEMFFRWGAGGACENNSLCPPPDEVTITMKYYGEPNWAHELIQAGTLIRDRIKGMKLRLNCVNAGKVEATDAYVGETKPICRHGTSSLHPGFLEWDAGSGELELEGSAGAVTARIEGEVKILGWHDSELINCKNT
jgi:hypothetical protein